MHYFVNRVNKKIILCIIKRYKNYVIINTFFIKLYDLLKEMKYIKVHEKMPKYKENKYFVQIKNKNVYPDWYKIN